MKQKELSDPINLNTSKFKPVKIIYNYNGFVIAQGVWENKEMVMACRWHTKKGIGYPNGFGHPQWMLMPGVFAGIQSDTSMIKDGCYTETLKMEFISRKHMPYVLSFEEAMSEVIRYGIDKKTITLRNVNERKDDSLISEVSENSSVIVRDVEITAIPYFKPYLCSVSGHNVYKRIYFADANNAEVVHNIHSHTKNIVEIPFQEFERLGFKLSDFAV